MSQSPSNPEKIVCNIYDALKTRLPQSLIAKLTFKEPRYHAKGDTKIQRGRILPQGTKSIFDPVWCFYEVGVGHYSEGGAFDRGGVGFVCFPDNKKCGKGIHTATVSDLITRFAAARPRFRASQRGSHSQCVFSYYPAMEPSDEAADDLAKLISATLPQFLALTVVK